MKMLLNKAHYPVTVLGPGSRIAIWFQGCSIRCKGCCSVDTWSVDSGAQLSVSDLLLWCREVGGTRFDGITITGGEPFEQPAPLLSLLRAFRAWRQAEALHFDVLLYSGLHRKAIEQKFSKHLALLDAFIPEPFVHKEVADNGVFGSTNQNVVILSPSKAVRAKYEQWVDAKVGHRRFQVQADSRGIWFIGVPRKGDLARLEEECRERGLVMEKVSWRA